MINLFKKLFIPSGEKSITAYDSWVVRWVSVRHFGNSIADQRDEVEIFPTETDAREFYDALTAAHRLCKCPTNKITITKNATKLSSAMANITDGF